jgi:hypothetical protein
MRFRRAGVHGILLREIGRYGEAFQAIDAAERFNPINPACADIAATKLRASRRSMHGDAN